MKYFINTLIFFISVSVNSQFIEGFRLSSVIDNVQNESVTFYNLTSVDGVFYVGSSKGVFTIDENKLIKKSDKIGPIRVLKKQRGVIFERIELYKKNIGIEFKDIIPLYFKDKVYSILQGRDDSLFLTINGVLYFFEKEKITITLRNSSIRSVSENFIGTYDGIFDMERKKINGYPNYTSSYIREFDNEVFINYDGIFRGNKSGEINEYRRASDGSISLLSQNIGFAEDVEKINDSNYYLFTSLGLYKSDFKNYLLSADTISNNERSEFNIKLINHYKVDERLLYYFDKKLKTVTVENDDISVLFSFKNPVKSISSLKNNIFFIDDNGVGQLSFLKEKRLINDPKFHTIKVIDSNNLALLSNYGFYKYNILYESITSIVENEFNKKSLEILNDSIYAGSIEGLYSISKKDFLNFKNKSEDIISTNESKKFYFLVLIIILLFVYIIYFKSKPVKSKVSLGKEIEEYIIINLSSITIEQIKNHFNISHRKLSAQFPNSSPGKVIQKKRKDRLQNMVLAGKSIDEISLETGYQKEYLKKLLKNYKG